MDKIYSLETKDGITSIRFSKTPEMTDLVVIIDYLSENNLYERRLWDLNPCGLNLNINQLQEIALYGKSKFRKPSKLAIVASDDLTYGLSRVFEVHREEELVKTKVFRAEQEARTWLME